MTEIAKSAAATREPLDQDRPVEPLRLENHTIALVLSGGNALGAYQAGAYQAMAEHGIEPDWVSGASTGAVNAAIICGNPGHKRIDALEALWKPARDRHTPHPSGAMDQARRTASAIWTFTMGYRDVFAPRHLLGPWFNLFGNQEPSSLYDTIPLGRTLERLVDFDLLNRGSVRFSATAIDLETGEDIVFDTQSCEIGPDHVRASSALLPAFPPVNVAGRLLGDAGISANLPLDGVLSEAFERPLLCIAIDLLPLRAPWPRTLGDAAIRAQDLLFASQSRRAIASWQAIFDARGRHDPAVPSATILHIAYSGHEREVSGKAFDFSPQSVGERWEAGYNDLATALAELASDRLAIGAPGLSVYVLSEDRERLEGVNHVLAPKPA